MNVLFLAAFAALGALVISDPALAACLVADAKVEKAIATKPELHGGAGTQVARDLRTLRDATVVLDAYGNESVCITGIASAVAHSGSALIL